MNAGNWGGKVRKAGYGGFDILGVFLTFYEAESFRNELEGIVFLSNLWNMRLEAKRKY